MILAILVFLFLFVLFGYADLVAYGAALRWKCRRDISWAEWDANRWRKLPGGGFYMLRKYRLTTKKTPTHDPR